MTPDPINPFNIAFQFTGLTASHVGGTIVIFNRTTGDRYSVIPSVDKTTNTVNKAMVDLRDIRNFPNGFSHGDVIEWNLIGEYRASGTITINTSKGGEIVNTSAGTAVSITTGYLNVSMM